MEHIVRTAPKLLDHTQKVIDQSAFLQNPYFESLRTGLMSREEFCQTQELFYFTVEFLPRPMSALISRLPHGHDRLSVLHGLMLECGELDSNNAVSVIFKYFLEKLGSDLKLIEDGGRVPSCSRVFNHILAATSSFDSLELGVACMGLTHRAFAEASVLIGQAVVDRGWVSKDDLVYYRTEDAELDLQTSEALLAVIEPSWVMGEKQDLIEQGFDLALYSLDRFYRDLIDL